MGLAVAALTFMALVALNARGSRGSSFDLCAFVGASWVLDLRFRIFELFDFCSWISSTLVKTF